MTTPATSAKPTGVPWVLYAKKATTAAVAFLLGVLGVLTVAVTAGSDGGAQVTTPEWLQAAWVGLSGLGGTIGVYVARNRTTGGTP